MTCPICNKVGSTRLQKVRSGESLKLCVCLDCEFEYFDVDPTKSISADNLDKTRLQAVELRIPNIVEDFENGIKQSEEYIDLYLDENDKGENLLEIGCSWGYFLKLTEDFGCVPYGLEINSKRSNYLNYELQIKCFNTLSEAEKSGMKFANIFLFYVLEYIPKPVNYLSRLINLLQKPGKIVIVTPNLKDPLKDIWKNRAFGEFFYDKHAVNYFSSTSLESLFQHLISYNNNLKHSTRSLQGYSIINHIGWFLNNKPSTTGRVGGDYFIDDLNEIFYEKNEICSTLKEMIFSFDRDYRHILQNNNYGNQIEFIILYD